ncbi:MAG: helix-turn-helix domain-containing protein [Thermoprotei archaeon]
MSGVQFVVRADASCTDLLDCLYNLNSIESRMFFTLANQGAMTLDQLAAKVGRDRTTTHRSLQKLVGAGLVYKRSTGLPGGGYCHVYSAVELSKIRRQAELKVNEICKGLRRLIDRFEDDVKKSVE